MSDLMVRRQVRIFNEGRTNVCARWMQKILADEHTMKRQGRALQYCFDTKQTVMTF